MTKKLTNPELVRRNVPLRQELLWRQLTGVMVAAMVLLPVSWLRAFEIGFRPVNAIQSLLFLAVLGIFIRRKHIKPQIAAVVLSIVVIVWCMVGVSRFGVLAPAQVILPFVAIFASIVFGHRTALRFFWASTVGLVIIGTLYLSGVIHYEFDVQRVVHSWSSWTLLLFAQAAVVFWYLFLIAPLNEADRHTFERLEAVLAGINDALFVHDKDSGAILQVNQKMCAMYGCSEQEALRLSIGDLSAGVPPYTEEDARAWMSKAANEGPQLFEWQAKDRHGRLFWVEVNMRLACLDATQRLLVMVRDITERKLAEQALRESERTTRAIFDLSYGFIGLLTPEGRLVDVNKTALDFIGLTLPDVQGKLFWDTPWWSHSEEAQQTIRDAVRLASRGQLVQAEAIHRAIDGTPHFIQFTLRPVKNDAGQVVALIPEGRDITEERAAQAQLLASNEKFLKLFHSSPDAILVTQLSGGKIVEVNKAFEKLSGFSRAELIDRQVLDFKMYSDTDRARFVLTLSRDQNVRDAEFTLKRRSGEELLVLASAELIEVDGEAHAITILHDITERKRAEVALRESEERFNTAFRFMPVGAGITTLGEGRFVAANKHFEEVFGYSERELLGRTTSEFGIWVNPEDRAHVVSEIQKGHSVHAFEVQIRRMDGSVGWASYSGVRVVLNGAEYLLSGAVDITVSKQATERLALLGDTIDATSDGVYWLDEDGRCIYVNSAGCTMLGYSQEELMNLRIFDVNPRTRGQRWIEIWQTLRKHKSFTYETVHCRKDGSQFPVEIAATHIKFGDKEYLNGFARDITERKSLEEQLRQSQKMEAIGILAGGVAHDFNNLLSVILNHTEFAMDGVPKTGPVADDLVEVMKASDRATALTRQLLAFSRKQVLQPQSLDLNDIAAGLEKMLRRILGEDIDYIQMLAPKLDLVRADPGQIEQVLMNLAVNARDAMPDGGKLTIETANVDLDGEYAANHVAVSPGRYVMIAVTDSGIGMDESTRTRIFEPFFTTKEKGRGTGLGLSTVYGIVKQSGGNLWVYSELGHGTTFKIYLPRELSTTTALLGRPTKAPKLIAGTETVLVVEDEVVLRSVARRILGSAGYTVLLAANGHQALQTSAEHAGPIHLLLTDVVMPKMNGRVLSEQLLQTRPDLKVIYMSGYTDNVIVHHGVLDAGTHFINKPIGAAELLRKIREILDG